MDPRRPEPPEEPPTGGPLYPDARPLRRIQAVTFGLIAVVALLTLLSGSRPAEVRWAALAGVTALVVAVGIVLRRRRGGGPRA
jgi:hypothetical protein